MAKIHDDPNTPPTAYISAAFVVVLIAVVVALQGYYGRVSSEVENEKVVEQSSKELADHRAEQQERLGRYESTDPDAGLVTIPVDRAMEIVAEELAGNGGSVSNP